MPSAIPSLNVGGVQPPYDPISSAAGSIQAVNPNELTITAGGTLQFINGPTIPATRGTSPLIINSNTSGVISPALGTATVADFQGPDGFNWTVNFDAFAGQSVFRQTRADGTAASPSAIQSNDVIGAWEMRGYNGSAYVSPSGLNGIAIENWTTAANGSEMLFNVIGQGTTTTLHPLVVTGATGAKAVQVTGGLSIDQAGTFIANGTTAVTVAATGVTANSVIIPSVHTASSPGAAPHVTSINAGTNFTIVATAGDASTYNYVIIN